jgi:hypothetical protein
MGWIKKFSVKNRNRLSNWAQTDVHFVIMSFCPPYDHSVYSVVTIFIIKTELMYESRYIFCFYSVLPYETTYILKNFLSFTIIEDLRFILIHFSKLDSRSIWFPYLINSLYHHYYYILALCNINIRLISVYRFTYAEAFHLDLYYPQKQKFEKIAYKKKEFEQAWAKT